MTTMYDRREYCWGGCPMCRARGEVFLTDGAGWHWFICETDGMRWCVGRGLFSVTRELTDGDRAYQRGLLALLRPIAAYVPEEIEAVAAVVELLEPDPAINWE